MTTASKSKIQFLLFSVETRRNYCCYYLPNRHFEDVRCSGIFLLCFQDAEEDAGTSLNSTSDADNQEKDDDKDSKKKKNRCATCRKKVGLTGESPQLIPTSLPLYFAIRFILISFFLRFHPLILFCYL